MKINNRDALTQKDIDRFNKYVPNKPDDGCWLWTGTKERRRGYGRFRVTGKGTTGAHRIAFIIAYGLIADGLEIDHKCHNPGCVRPSHLQAVTRAQHVLITYRRDGAKTLNGSQTHCKYGHDFTEENTRVYKRYDGGFGRCCRACDRARWHRRKTGKLIVAA